MNCPWINKDYLIVFYCIRHLIAWKRGSKFYFFYAILLKYKILLLQSFSEFFLFVDWRTMMYVLGNYQEKTDFDSSSGHLQALFTK